MNSKKNTKKNHGKVYQEDNVYNELMRSLTPFCEVRVKIVVNKELDHSIRFLEISCEQRL